MSAHAAPDHDAAQPIYDWQSFGFETRQVHAGEYPDKNHGLRVPPIALSAGYLFDDFDDQVNRFNGSIHWRAENDGPRGEGEAFSPSEHAPIYSRQGNPSNWVAEERLASLEGGTVAVAVASGQAAISAALFTLAGRGDHLVSTASIYGGTRAGANGIVRAVGLEHARDGVQVNAVGTDSQRQHHIVVEVQVVLSQSFDSV